MEDDPATGCGHSRLWMLPSDHPFIPACQLHDSFYDRRKNPDTRIPAKIADRLFFEEMKKLAGDSPVLKLQARVFYGIVRAWSFLSW